MQSTVHNPDRFIADLRQILAQGRKRIGLLVGAGAAVSVRVNANGQLNSSGSSLIPDVAGLTQAVLGTLDQPDAEVIAKLLPELGEAPNIETILTRVRRLAQAIGSFEVHGMSASGYEGLAERICKIIGTKVAAKLPKEPNPYTEIVAWVGGTHRDSPVEIFTPNYDLLFEEAFESARLPYFDGFSGAHRPFFDPTSVNDDVLPARWTRLWKIHGSLGWEVSSDSVVRTGSRDATSLIYPDHLKYDQIARLPFSSLFERLRNFLKTPDSLLICTGFSFFDAHITSVIDEALASNTHTAVLACQFGSLEKSSLAVKVALRRPNLSVYANDGAVVYGVPGKWVPGQLPSDEWRSIRDSFWDPAGNNGEGRFTLGDFARLSRFVALTQAVDFATVSDLAVPAGGTTASESGATTNDTSTSVGATNA